MEKQIITFSADEQKLVKTGGINCYASNIVSYIEAHFALGQNWSGYDSVRAVWSNDNNMTVISTVLDSNGICVVPFEVLKTMGVVKVNLVGSISVSDTLTDRLTTFPCEALTVARKAKISGSETTPITPSQFEQFVAQVTALVATVKDVESTALNDDYTLTINFSDGTSTTVGPIRGAQGPRGESGVMTIETVSGTTPTITAETNTVYICGEVVSLDFTPCSEGICEVIFESGTTPTVLTIPQTVKMPANFAVKSNTTYEISILKGIYGAVQTWT